MVLVLDSAAESGYMADEIEHFLPDACVYIYPNEDGDLNVEDVDGVVTDGSEVGMYDEPNRGSQRKSSSYAAS